MDWILSTKYSQENKQTLRLAALANMKGIDGAEQRRYTVLYALRYW